MFLLFELIFLVKTGIICSIATFMQLNLRHGINSKILIYPGYVPEPGVKYRVFHYGLEFVVGDWSFDKAKWRDTDLVNKCWAKFPDPPDPSMLAAPDDNILQRDLLSIECAKKLNEALYLHHKRRNCPDPNSLSTSAWDTGKEATMSRKFGRFEESYVAKNDQIQMNISKQSSVPGVTDKTFSSFRFWLIGLWVFSVLGFLAVMLVLFLGRRGRGGKTKSYKSKRRSYPGILDVNGRDRDI